VRVGDEVWYLPHEVHSREVDAFGRLAWVFAWKRHPHLKAEEAVELSNEDAIEKIVAIRNTSNDPGLSSQLVRLRVAQPWLAHVRAVSEDGRTADLDVCCRNLVHRAQPDQTQSSWPLVLHYDGVPITPRSDNKPHSCCAKEVG
jgi:hypothetical protein